MLEQSVCHFILEQYKADFRKVVLDHVSSQLQAEEWGRLRALSGRQGPESDTLGDLADPNLVAEKLFDQAVSEDGLAIDDILIPAFKGRAIELAPIAGQPVRYVEGQGIYIWSPDASCSPTLSFWVTFPAYPPGW